MARPFLNAPASFIAFFGGENPVFVLLNRFSRGSRIQIVAGNGIYYVVLWWSWKRTKRPPLDWNLRVAAGTPTLMQIRRILCRKWPRFLSQSPRSITIAVNDRFVWYPWPGSTEKWWKVPSDLLSNLTKSSYFQFPAAILNAHWQEDSKNFSHEFFVMEYYYHNPEIR